MRDTDERAVPAKGKEKPEDGDSFLHV